MPREDHDQRGLPHVRGLAAHVRPGDQQHAALVVQHQVIRHERAVDVLLDDQVPAAADLDAGFGGELRSHQPQRHRALGKIREHVECSQRASRSLQPTATRRLNVSSSPS